MLVACIASLAFSVGRPSPRQHAFPCVRMAAEEVAFTKYHGLGNDFVLVDCRELDAPPVTPEVAAAMCDRNFGVGGDGVIFALPPQQPESMCSMRIYNSDGSEPEMCGNGIRCLARFFASLQKVEPTYTIDTLAGPIRPTLLPDGAVKVDMGEPILDGPSVPTTLPVNDDGVVVAAPISAAGADFRATCVSMGNPHAAIFVDDLDALDFETVGPALESHPAFPAKCNIEFVQVLSRTHLRMKVWERGAGPTLACGTGACALLVAAVLEGRAERAATVSLPGGDLFIEWHEGTNRISMTGPALRVFDGTYRPEQ
jgi:diaminopimelate epimerase